MKEAAARITINKPLEAAGWRFFADDKGPANIQLEPSVTIQQADLDKLGQNFEKAKKGFIDFLLRNEQDFPFIVLEAKSEDKNPLVGKEQPLVAADRELITPHGSQNSSPRPCVGEDNYHLKQHLWQRANASIRSRNSSLAI